MKFNSKYFSFPPYISTNWANVIALHMNDDVLIISLVDGNMVEIPGLQEDTIDHIFAVHAEFLEQDSQRDLSNRPSPPNKIISSLSSLFDNSGDNTPFKIGFSAMDSFGSMLQHNPNQANSPELPKEILQKISAIAKIVGPENPDLLPKAEPHCNCMYCQIARAVTQEPVAKNESKTTEETPVSDAELTFCQWEIHPSGDKMYTVTNRLETSETYTVYLGEPVGCTCGKSGCEHILAVLQS